MRVALVIFSLLIAGGAAAQTRGGAPASPGVGQTYATPAGTGTPSAYVSGNPADIAKVLNSPAVAAGTSTKELSLRDLRDDALDLQAKDGGKLTAKHAHDIEATYKSIMADGG